MMENNYYNVSAISNSALKVFCSEQGGSPKKYKAWVVDGLGDKEQSPSLTNGKLIHKYIEEPAAFVVDDVDRPSDMIVEWCDRALRVIGTDESIFESNLLLKQIALNTKGDLFSNIKKEDTAFAKFSEGLSYMQSRLRLSGKHILSLQEKKILDGVKGSIEGNPRVANMLADNAEENLNEFPMFWKDAKTNLQLKGLADKVKIWHSEKLVQLIDFKTTSKPLSDYHESFMYWRTYRQLAMYAKGLMNTLDLGGYKLECYVVAQELQGIYENDVFFVEDALINQGFDEVSKLLAQIKHCEVTGIWDDQDAHLLGYRTLKYVS